MARSPHKPPTRLPQEGGDAALLQLVEENLRFLAELRSNGRSLARGGPLGRCVSRPADVYELVRPEMEHLLQEQVRVVLLDTSCRVLDVTAETAAVRLETPWFVDHFHMGRFDGRWVIVNALWHSKPR